MDVGAVAMAEVHALLRTHRSAQRIVVVNASVDVRRISVASAASSGRDSRPRWSRSRTRTSGDAGRRGGGSSGKPGVDRVPISVIRPAWPCPRLSLSSVAVVWRCRNSPSAVASSASWPGAAARRAERDARRSCPTPLPRGSSPRSGRRPPTPSRSRGPGGVRPASACLPRSLPHQARPLAGGRSPALLPAPPAPDARGRACATARSLALGGARRRHLPTWVPRSRRT